MKNSTWLLIFIFVNLILSIISNDKNMNTYVLINAIYVSAYFIIKSIEKPNR